MSGHLYHCVLFSISYHATVCLTLFLSRAPCSLCIIVLFSLFSCLLLSASLCPCLSLTISLCLSLALYVSLSSSSYLFLCLVACPLFSCVLFSVRLFVPALSCLSPSASRCLSPLLLCVCSICLFFCLSCCKKKMDTETERSKGSCIIITI